jgi:hypothetical protein
LKRFFQVTFAVGLILACGFSGAQTQTATDAPKPALSFNPVFSSVMFGNFLYSVRGTEGKYANRFDFDRVYFTMKTPLAEDWKFQVTTDIYRNASATSYYNGLAIRIKFAMVEYVPVSSVSVKFGMIPGPWNGLVETYWKYRGVATTASDKFGLIATADAGISAAYTLPGKIGDVSVYMYNGTGYAAPEANRFKDYVARLTLAPFASSDELKGLTVSGIAYVGNNGTAIALQKNRFGAFVGYTYSVFMVGSEYLVVKNAPTNPDSVQTGNLLSVFAELKSPVAGFASQFSLIGRFDVNEPNVNKGGDITRTTIVGLVFKANDRVWWVVDNQQCRTEKATQKAVDGSSIAADVRWYLHAIITF